MLSSTVSRLETDEINVYGILQTGAIMLRSTVRVDYRQVRLCWDQLLGQITDSQGFAETTLLRQCTSWAMLCPVRHTARSCNTHTHNTHTHTHTHTNTHTHTHTHTYTHTHTHTHVRMCLQTHSRCHLMQWSSFLCAWLPKIWILISLRVCSRWLNKGFVHIAPSVSQFVLLFQKKILFWSLCMLGIETTYGTHLRSM